MAQDTEYAYMEVDLLDKNTICKLYTQRQLRCSNSEIQMRAQCPYRKISSGGMTGRGRQRRENDEVMLG